MASFPDSVNENDIGKFVFTVAPPPQPFEKMSFPWAAPPACSFIRVILSANFISMLAFFDVLVKL